MDRVSHALNLVGNTVGGKYALRRVLGVGGMGAVYEAVHAYTNRRVALKILGPDYAASPDATARFLQEAQAPSSIGHPNIVEVLDAGEDPAVGLYLVLEYLDGEDMESAVEHGRLDLAALLDATLQLLDALGAAHARGFVHRDIKPANVFLVRDRAGRLRAKLLDFGIARDVARGLTVGNVVMGTPHYMSPEQAQGLPVDARADLWSVGAMLFHALAGVAPFDGDNPNVIMVNIILQDAPPLGPRRPDLSKTLVHAVDRALAKSPDARWPDAARMATQLAAAPERLDGSLKITSTLRNRAGAVSGMRPQAGPGAPGVDAVGVTVHSVVPPRPGTGTLGADDPPPAADAPAPRSPPLMPAGGTLASQPAPPLAAVPATAPMAAPAPAPAPAPPALASAPAPVAPTRRAPLVAGVALAVAAATLAVVYALRAPSSPRVASSAVLASPDASARALVTADASPAPAVAPVAAPTVAAPVAAPAAPVAAPPERVGRGRRRTRRGDDRAPAAAPEAPRAPSTTHISGVPIGTYP